MSIGKLFLGKAALIAGGVVGTAIGGPLVGYAFAKTAAAAVTGNPLHLVPLSGAAAHAADLVDVSDASSDIHGNDPRANGHGNTPTDIHGNEWGRGIHGNGPRNAHGGPA